MTPSPMIVLAGLLGLIVGSFLGTLVVRLPKGRPVIFARSQCDHCHTVLAAWQLLPIAGYLYQRGRCARCGAPISLFYPFIEVAGAALAVWAACTTAGEPLGFTLVLGWLLLALAAMDARTLRLSVVLMALLLAAGLAAAWRLDPSHVGAHAIGAFAGWAALAIVGVAYRWLRRRPGLGAGDARLLAASGAWVGWQGLPSVVLISSVIALIIVVCQILAGRDIKFESKLPFGAYLCGGTWIAWLYGPILW